MRAYLLISMCKAGLLILILSTLTIQSIDSQLPLASLLEAAQTHLTQGELQEAILYYTAILDKQPGDYLTFFKRALAQLSLGHIQEAKTDLEIVLSLRPGFEGAHLQLARIKFEQSDWATAKAHLLAAGKRATSPEVTRILAAEGAEVKARTAHGLEQWTVCIDQANHAISFASRSPSLYQLRAWCYLQRGEAENGILDLQRALIMRPGETDWHITSSVIKFYALGELTTGLAETKKCLVFDPDSDTCRSLYKQQRVVQTQFAEADEYLRRGQVTTACRLLRSIDGTGLLNKVQQQILEIRGSGRMPAVAGAKLYENILEMVCQAHFQSGHKDASRYCDETLRTRPESFWGLTNRGKTLLKAGKFEDAQTMLERAAELWPDKNKFVMPLLQKTKNALARGKTRDYYKVLDVPRDASERQLKAAYRASVKKYHPDKVIRQGISKEDAERRMASINEAFEVLSDPEKRANFDNGNDPITKQNSQPFSGSPFQYNFFGADNPLFFQQDKEGSSQGNFRFSFHTGGTNRYGL